MFFLGNMHYESTILLTSVYGNIICESIRRHFRNCILDICVVFSNR